MDEIDKLLANLSSEPKPTQPPTRSASQRSNGSIDDLLQELETPPSPAPIPQAPSPQRLLETMKSEYEQQQAAALQQAELERQQQAQQKQHRLEQLKQQRRAELTETAAHWLKTLSPKSTEGRWFEEFACNYESRLEAAIDYLEALQEVNSDSIEVRPKNR